MRSSGSMRSFVVVLVLLLVSSVWVGAAAAVAPAAHPGRDFAIRTLSTEADLVTGGDVLVEVTVPAGVAPGDVVVWRNGVDVTAAFQQAGEGSLVGVVDGLREGSNRIVVWANKRGRWLPVAALRVVNHPITGPVFSGPHQEPFICETEAFGLGPPLDEDCSAESKVEYVYLSSETEDFQPYDPDAPPPGDVAQTTTTEGDTVDYIVRVETGTINRAVYQIAFLHEPGQPAPDPWTSTPGWNGRLVYTFGGGCDAAYRQGATTGGVLNPDLLSPGFALASSSHNVFGNNCNDVTSAETAMMVKEHFIESFGLDRHTIGWGGSGGSMQQHLIAQNYPGILDGITPASSYPDITTLIPPVTDCSLLFRAFAEGSQSWTLEQVSAVTGYANNGSIETCSHWTDRPPPSASYARVWINPEPCPAVIPPALVYDPVTNPGGARCTVHDNTVNVYGRDPDTGFARRPLDNAGVQYGLEAFNDGVITFEQFAEVNELAGGFDIDGNLIAERTVADPEALDIAYATGRVNSGSGGLADVPIIDFRAYRETLVDIHDRFRSFSTRERLITANGHADNHVIWITPVGVNLNTEVLLLMDQWLTAVANDSGGGTAADKVVRNKPADAVDSCWTPEGDRIVEPATYDGPGTCNELYPSHADPRVAAGAPVANDVLKCTLKPVDETDYASDLTSEQLDRLRGLFPHGVCNYDVPGVGQQPLKGTWLHY